MNIASTIDHTLLRPDATAAMIDTLCEEAMAYQFKAVCVSPAYAKQSLQRLAKSTVQVASVVGFSSGANLTETKLDESRRLAELGVHELDMVMAVHALKNQKLDYVAKEIALIAQEIKQINSQLLLKVIIETALLTQDEIKSAALLCLENGADFVKTSTGFHGRGASVEDVTLINEITQGKIAIKASGGIRNLDDALSLIKAGASRLGTSSGVALASNQPSQPGSY